VRPYVPGTKTNFGKTFAPAATPFSFAEIWQLPPQNAYATWFIRGTQHPLWYPAACSERPDREAGGVTWHEAVSTTTMRAFAYGRGTIRVYQTVFPQRRDRQWEATSEQVATVAHCRAPIVLHDYIPELLQKLRTKFPEFRLYLHESARAEAERLLLARDVDLAITLVERKSRAGIQVRPLLKLPLILLVPRKSRIARAEELWKRDKIEETLISLPRTDPIHASFQRGLEDLGVEWFCGIEVNSARLIERYVAGGYGIGLAVSGPRLQATWRGARFGVADISPGRCGCVVVRQTFKHFEAIAGRTGNRGASANAPNETWSSPLSESNLVAVAEWSWYFAGAELHAWKSGVKPPHSKAASPRKVRVDSCEFVV
jgi:DNA-binding transcriptional LysR family regulator